MIILIFAGLLVSALLFGVLAGRAVQKTSYFVPLFLVAIVIMFAAFCVGLGMMTGALR